MNLRQASAKEIIRTIYDGLKSGRFVHSDFELEITQLESIVDEYRRKQEDMDCAVPCNGICRSCKQPVVWVVMVPSMKSTPINPELEEGGNVEVRRNGTGKLFGKVTGPDPEMKKHTSHFANCPDADEWRNR